MKAATGRKRGRASTVLCGRLTNASHCSEGPNNGKGRRTGSKRQQDKRNKNDMAQQAITLKIAGKSYSLNIESEKEEVYRLAEREVNNYLAAIKQNNFKNWTDQDYLSMAALKFAIANVDMRQSRELGDEDLKHLGRLGEEIDAYLNTLQR